MTTTKNTTESHHYVIRAGFLAMALWRSWANTKVRIGRWAGCYQRNGVYVGVQAHVWRYFFGVKGDAIYETSQGPVFFHAPEPSKTNEGRTQPIMPVINEYQDPSRGFWLCDHNHDFEYVWSDEDGDEIKRYTYTHSDACVDLADPMVMGHLIAKYYVWVESIAKAEGERSEWTQKLIDTAVIDGDVTDNEIAFVFSTVETFLKECGKAKQAFERAEKAVGRKAVPEHLYGSRTLITGSITELKTEWTDYGERTSISIRDDRGFDFIVTAPKAIKEECQEGVRIRLEATVKEWNKVEGLAYGQRPSKGVIL